MLCGYFTICVYRIKDTETETSSEDRTRNNQEGQGLQAIPKEGIQKKAFRARL